MCSRLLTESDPENNKDSPGYDTSGYTRRSSSDLP